MCVVMKALYFARYFFGGAFEIDQRKFKHLSICAVHFWGWVDLYHIEWGQAFWVPADINDTCWSLPSCIGCNWSLQFPSVQCPGFSVVEEPQELLFWKWRMMPKGSVSTHILLSNLFVMRKPYVSYDHDNTWVWMAVHFAFLFNLLCSVTIFTERPTLP